MVFGLCFGVDWGDTEGNGEFGGEATSTTFKEEEVDHASLRQQNELLLDESITGTEREDYLKMLDGFPNLFANSYSQVQTSY